MTRARTITLPHAVADTLPHPGATVPCDVCTGPDTLFGASRGSGHPSPDAALYGATWCVRCGGRGSLVRVTVTTGEAA